MNTIYTPARHFFSNDTFVITFFSKLRTELLFDTILPSSQLLSGMNNVIFTYSHIGFFKELVLQIERRETMKHLGLEMFIDNMEGRSEPKWETSLPEVKLYYPEPFIASPSFNHEEIWFIHILHYNY
jgi:hypothetical protein